jgi:hemoglobin
MDSPRKIYVPPGGPPQGPKPNAEIYAKMGEKNIYKMIEDFYKELEKSDVRYMFPKDMIDASKKTAEFFIFLVGGPPLYHEKHGSPMMRQRHLPFKIDAHARLTWLSCFKKVLEDADKKYNFPMEHLPGFVSFIENFSEWMVNTRDP